MVVGWVAGEASEASVCEGISVGMDWLGIHVIPGVWHLRDINGGISAEMVLGV